jgi:UDPglucose 6-dehydrogenase
VDSDRAKIAALKAGKLPIFEPGLDEIFRRARARKRLNFAHSIKDGMRAHGRNAQAVFIAVGTPPRADGSADLSAVEAVAAEVALNFASYTVIIDKSTVPVETGEWVERTIARLNKKKIPCDVVSNPEFLSEGSAVRDFLKPDRIVLGLSSARAERVMRGIYAPIKAPVLVTDVKSAELIKHASNSFLATKISFINAVSALCERVGADVEAVSRGMGLDRRIGESFLRAGIGFGGFCFPKDLEAFYWISRQKGYDFKLLKDVQEINEFQKAWVMRRISEELWNLDGKTVALWGLAFKPNTDDLRFAPSLDIAAMLKERGMKIRATDPACLHKAKGHPGLKGVALCRDLYDAAKGADAAVLVTEWPEYEKPDFKKLAKVMRNPLILDGRNFYEPAAVKAAGFDYRGVGRP